MTQTDVISLMIADDHSILRHGLRESLENDGSFRIVAEAKTGHEAVDLAGRHNPDVLLMDVNMPELNGMEATRRILAQNPNIRILGLSMHSATIYVMGMMQAGASGYILKTCSFKELLTAVRTVHQGNAYLSPEIAGTVVTTSLRTPSDGQRVSVPVLSSRCKEVLQLIAEGKTSAQIADTLKISRRTVDVHRRTIIETLNVKTVADMTKCAIRMGLTTMD